MVRGCLLDTNIITYWFHGQCKQHDRVTLKINSLPPETPLRISVITWGEIQYGHQIESKEPTPIQIKFAEFVQDRFPRVLEIGEPTTTYYGELRARLFKKYRPESKRKKGRWPEELVDPTTGKELGIQENDLWISAQAVEYNLTLVTHDRMERIRRIADDLVVEDWASPG